MSVSIVAFPLRVAPGWRASEAHNRSSGGMCPNSAEKPGRVYRSLGQDWPIERPVLYDSFDAARGSRTHAATDISCAAGTPVVAPVAGKVLVSTTYQGQSRPGAGWSENGGNYVYLRDAAGNTHYFAHMAEPANVVPGQDVVAGQQLGLCGDTGNAVGGCPHLHYGIRDARGQAINPVPLLQALYDAGGWQGTPAAMPGTLAAPGGWSWGWVAAGAGIGLGLWWLARRQV